MQAGPRLSAEEWQALSTHWKDSLNPRIQKLQRLRDELGSFIG
ncbi:MerR family DNA-binding protein [Halomonas halmophila]